MCQISYKRKTPILLVSDKLIVSLHGLNRYNSPSQIDHPKYTILEIDNVTLEDILQNYFKE